MRKAIKIIRDKLNQKPNLTNSCVELHEEPIPEMTLITTLSMVDGMLTAELNGENLTAETTEEMVELLMSLGITASDLRFTADDSALTVGQVVEIRSALRLRNYIPQESDNHGLETAVEPPNSKV